MPFVLSGTRFIIANAMVNLVPKGPHIPAGVPHRSLVKTPGRIRACRHFADGFRLTQDKDGWS